MKFLPIIVFFLNSLIISAQNSQPILEITDLQMNRFLVFQNVLENQDSIQFLTNDNKNITISFSEIREIKILSDSNSISVYQKILSSSFIKDSLTSFNMNDFILQALGGYAFGISAGIAAGFIINNSTPDPSGFLSVIGGIMTFAVISPYAVQFIGESIDESQQVESNFTFTCVGAAVGGLISGGILIPVGAAAGYQSNKSRNTEFIDFLLAPDWVLKRVRR